MELHPLRESAKCYHQGKLRFFMWRLDYTQVVALQCKWIRNKRLKYNDLALSILFNRNKFCKNFHYHKLRIEIFICTRYLAGKSLTQSRFMMSLLGRLLLELDTDNLCEKSEITDINLICEYYHFTNALFHIAIYDKLVFLCWHQNKSRKDCKDELLMLMITVSKKKPFSWGLPQNLCWAIEIIIILHTRFPSFVFWIEKRKTSTTQQHSENDEIPGVSPALYFFNINTNRWFH